MEDKKRIVVFIESNEHTFRYEGTLISDKDGFLTIDDFKEGIIHLNKLKVIQIKEVGTNEQ